MLQYRKKGSDQMPRPAKDEGQKNLRLIVSLPPELDQQLRQYAKKNERPLSWVIQKALAEWLERNQ